MEHYRNPPITAFESRDNVFNCRPQNSNPAKLTFGVFKSKKCFIKEKFLIRFMRYICPIPNDAI